MKFRFKLVSKLLAVWWNVDEACEMIIQKKWKIIWLIDDAVLFLISILNHPKTIVYQADSTPSKEPQIECLEWKMVCN